MTTVTTPPTLQMPSTSCVGSIQPLFVPRVIHMRWTVAAPQLFHEELAFVRTRANLVQGPCSSDSCGRDGGEKSGFVADCSRGIRPKFGNVWFSPALEEHRIWGRRGSAIDLNSPSSAVTPALVWYPLQHILRQHPRGLLRL